MSSVVKKIQYIVFLIFALFAVASCSSDDSLTQEAPADEYVAKAKEREIQLLQKVEEIIG